MSDRREFVTTLVTGVTGLAGTTRGPSAAAVEVDARTTVFQSHPDGRTTLVRFTASGSTAPAGRLRVFDRRSRLLGTAGMLRRDDRLVGELWLPIDGRTRVRSELETPETRRPVRTGHVLRRAERWTIYVFTVADPVTVEDRLLGVPALIAGTRRHLLARAGVRGNPVSLPDGPVPLEHLELLRSAVPAARLAERVGIPTAAIALVSPGADVPHLAPILAGSGVHAVATRAEVGDPLALGFARGRRAMAREIERWLGEMTEQSSIDRTAIVVGTDPDLAVASQDALREWNARYAYPRIVVGEPESPIAPQRTVATAAAARPEVPPTGVLQDVARERAAASARRARNVFGPLARAAAPDEPTLEGIAARFAFPVSGLLVFNPSPFGRSDAIRVPGGGMRVVTDVPGLGYAFVPTTGEAEGRAGGSTDDGLTVENETYRLTIDDRTGAVASVVVTASGLELAGDDGINALDRSRLVEVSRERIAGSVERLRLARRTGRGTVMSTVELYAGLPRIDLTNEASIVGSDPLACEFSFAAPAARVEWEVAGGTSSAEPPIGTFTHLRWMTVRAQAGSVFLAAPDTGFAAMPDPRRLLAYAGSGTVRFRLGFTAFAVADDPWRFGWGADPLVAVPTAGRGRAGLPTFGRLFEVRDPGASIIAVKPADDGRGTIVYVQELAGIARTVSFAPGLLRFDRAMHCDLTERDLGPAGAGSDGAARIPLAPFGFSALRLLGLHLAA